MQTPGPKVTSIIPFISSVININYNKHYTAKDCETWYDMVKTLPASVAPSAQPFY